MFLVDAVNHAEPLREHAVVRFVATLQELGDFDKRNRLLLVEFLVFLVLEAHVMPVVARFGKPVEHLEANEVQVAQVVVVALAAGRDRMLGRVEDEPVGEGIILHMLHFQNDTVLVSVVHHDIRGDFLAESAGHCGIREGEMVDTVAPVKVEDGIEKIYGNPLVFGIAEEKLEDGVVVDVDIRVLLAVLRDAGGNVATLPVGFVDVGKHGRVLFFGHFYSFCAGKAPAKADKEAPIHMYIRFSHPK